MNIWRCPDCGSGVRAPGKPRRNDVRRFCFPCSQRSGYMVERVCPTLEKKRATSKARVSAKGKAVRAKVTAVREIKKASADDMYFVDGVDVRPIYKRMQTILKSHAQEIGEPGHRVKDPFAFKVTAAYLTKRKKLKSAIWHLSADLLYFWAESRDWRDPDFERICTRFRSTWRHDVVKKRNGWPEAYGGS